MTKNGWIKLFKRESEWFKELSNAEIVYLVVARMATEWNQKKDDFGTFDGRIKEMKKLLGWSDATISKVGNLLSEKNIIQDTEDHRRKRITNADLFFSKGSRGREAEKIISDTKKNLHVHELNIRVPEYFPDKIKQQTKDLRDKMKMFSPSKKKNQE